MSGGMLPRKFVFLLGLSSASWTTLRPCYATIKFVLLALYIFKKSTFNERASRNYFIDLYIGISIAGIRIKPEGQARRNKERHIRVLRSGPADVSAEGGNASTAGAKPV